MTITLVGQATDTNSGNVTINAPTDTLGGAFSPAAGDLMVAVAVSSLNDSITATGFSNPILVDTPGGTTDDGLAIFYKVMGASETSWVFTMNGSNRVYAFWFRSDVAGTWTLDKQSSNNPTANVNARDTGSTGTLAAAAEACVAGLNRLTGPTSGTTAVSDGFTLHGQQSLTGVGAAAYKITAATTALNPDFTWSGTANDASAGIVTFQLVPLGTTVTPASVPVVLGVDTPTIVTSADVPATPVGLVVGINTPTITAGGAVPVPADVPLVMGIDTPTIVVGTFVAVPAPVALVLDVPTPTIVSDQTVSVPAAAALVLAVPTPTVATDTTVPVATVAFELGVPTPGMAASAEPAPVALVMAIPTPTIVSDTAVAVPAPVALVLGVPTPVATATVGMDVDLRWSILGAVGLDVDLRWMVLSDFVPTIVVSTDDLLDLRNIGVRSSCFRWEVLTVQHEVVAEIHPSIESPPTISNDVTRAIKRDLRGLVLPPGEAAGLIPLQHRIRPVMVLENGDEFPLGIFLFVDATRVPHTYGELFTGALYDQCFTVDQGTGYTIALATGTSIRDVIILGLFASPGLTEFYVDGFSGVIERPIQWPAGVSRLKVINDLCALGGCYDFYVDNLGRGQVKTIPANPTTVPPTVTYVDGECGTGGGVGNILEGTTLLTDNILRAPNLYRVIDTSAQSTPIVGEYEVPADAPHSFFHRGFYIVQTINEQGLRSTAEAVQRAKAAALQAREDFVWLSFQGVIDPRHDTYDILSVRGLPYREQKWSMQVVEGAPMSHDCRQVFAP